jgi:hypothetical protein
MLAEKVRDLSLDRLGQQGTCPIAQDFCELIVEDSWLNQMNDVIVGHGISLLRWRSGGVKHPHDMPPSRFPPSPTFGDSSTGQRKMTPNVLSRIFTIEIGDTPTLSFEAQNLREAQQLCHEQWLKDDLAEAKSDGAPLWDGKAKLRARMALPDESALFTEANDNGQPSDGLMLVYLIDLDGEEPPVDLGTFPPART